MNEYVPPSLYCRVLRCILGQADRSNAIVFAGTEDLLNHIAEVCRYTESQHSYLLERTRRELRHGAKKDNGSRNSNDADCLSVAEYANVFAEIHKHASTITKPNQVEQDYGGNHGFADPQCAILADVLASACNISNLDRNAIKLTIFLEWPCHAARDKVARPLSNAVLGSVIDNLAPVTNKEADKDTVMMISGIRPDVINHLTESASKYMEMVITDVCSSFVLFPCIETNIAYTINIKSKNLKELSKLKVQEIADMEIMTRYKTRILEKLDMDISHWLQKHVIRSDGLLKEESIDITKELCEALSGLNSALNDNGAMLQKYFQMVLDEDYMNIILQYVARHLYDVSKLLLKSMQDFRSAHIENEDDVEACSKSSMRLYYALREFVEASEKCINRPINEYDISRYQELFHTWLVNWYLIWQKVSKSLVIKLVQNEDKLKRVEPTANIAESGVMSLNILVTGVINDWMNLKFEDPKVRLVGTTRVTDIFCDGVNAYCRNLWKFAMAQQGSISKEEFAVAANTMAHMADYISTELPLMLEYESLFEALRNLPERKDSKGNEEPKRKPDDEARRNLAGIRDVANIEIFRLAEETAAMMLQNMFPELQTRIVDEISQEEEGFGLFRKMKRYMTPEKLYEIPFLLHEAVQWVHANVLECLYSVVYSAIWAMCINTLLKNIKLKQRPVYYQEILRFMDNFEECMNATTKSPMNEDAKEKYNRIKQDLAIKTQSTNQLLLQYYIQRADETIKLGEKNNNAAPSIDVTISRDRGTTEADTQLNITIHGARNLPITDRIGECDYFITAELQPESAFTQKYFMESKVVKKSSNPQFNQACSFEIPIGTAELPGTAVLLTAWDYDRLSKNDLIGEVVILVKDVQLGSSFEPGAQPSQATLNLILPRCKQCTKQGLVAIIKERTSFDAYAKAFMEKQGKLLRRRKNECGHKSDDSDD